MLERPSDGLGDDFATLPDVTVLDAVASTLNCRLTFHIVCDTVPFLGTVRTEMERGIAYGVSVVRNVPGVIIGTAFTTERALVVRKDVFGDGLGQRQKNRLFQSSVPHVRFRDERPNRAPVLGVVNVSERADGRVVRMTLFSLSL